jgi:hypothetical protein
MPTDAQIAAKGRYENRKATGRCPRCCRPALPNQVLCGKCVAATARRARRLRAEGLCVVCGKFPARPGRLKCESCTEKANARARRRSRT